MSAIGDTPVKTKLVTATEMGWIKRPDMGPRVWETKNGTLYGHYENKEPTFLTIDTTELFPHLKGRISSEVEQAADNR